MNEYSQTTKPSNKIAPGASVILFILAVFLITFATVFKLPYAGIYQSVAIVFFSVSLLLIHKYLLKSFIYRVKKSDGGYDLTITEVRGKSVITVCRVSLSNVEKVEQKTKENADSLKKEAIQGGRKTFSYIQDIAPKKEHWIFVTECGEPYLLKIAADDTLLAILKCAESENKNNKTNANET